MTQKSTTELNLETEADSCCATGSCSDAADVGTIIDNSDCVTDYDHAFLSESEAQQKLAALTELAKEVASEPCKIESSIQQEGIHFHLKASFTFCCGAENLIYQLKARSLTAN